MKREPKQSNRDIPAMTFPDPDSGKKPDFDQVSELSLSQPLPEGKALLAEAKGVSNLEPLPAGKVFSFKQPESGQELELHLKRELYFETEDLAH